MRVLVVGAYGFIGSEIVADLLAQGHEIVGVGRNIQEPARRFPAVRWVALDIARATRPEDWLPHLAGVDAVVNCAGVLQDSLADSTRGVHVDGIGALFAACERAQVRRVLHFSAIGADENRPTEFSRSKGEADAALMARDLDWIILRPSVVLGRSAYGGSALIRGLAGLPGILPEMPGTGRLQVVQLDDVMATVRVLLRPEAPSRQVLQLAGPQPLAFTDIVLAYRRWLGLPEPRRLQLPPWLARAAFRAGDMIAWLGWRPPIRSTAEREIAYGAVGDPTEWTRVTGIVPRSLEGALAARPASVQERWFAKLYLLKPLVFGILALFWISTGIMSLGPGYGIGESLMREGGVEGPLAVAAIVGGGLLDLVIGIAIAFRRTTKLALKTSILAAVVYAIIGTILVPRLWIDPLGPMLKIWPIIVFTLMALAIADDR